MARTLKGTIYAKKTAGAEVPMAGAWIRLERGGVAVASTTSDANGKFSFDLSDKGRHPPGRYVVAAVDPDGARRFEPTDAVVGKGRTPVTLVAKSTGAPNACGWILLIALIAMLGALAWTYVGLHRDHPNPHRSVDPTLSQSIGSARALVEGRQAIDDPERVAALLASSRRVLAALPTEPGGALSATESAVIESLLSIAEDALDARDPIRLANGLGDLSDRIEIDAGYFWWQPPWNLVEVLFWAGAATLARLILLVAKHLADLGFLAREIARHLGYLATVPILAVLITFVLSFVDISIALGESLLRLDLGDSTVAVLVAALIGLAPWRATAFLSRLADRLFDWLAGLVRRRGPADG